MPQTRLSLSCGRPSWVPLWRSRVARTYARRVDASSPAFILIFIGAVFFLYGGWAPCSAADHRSTGGEARRHLAFPTVTPQ